MTSNVSGEWERDEGFSLSARSRRRRRSIGAHVSSGERQVWAKLQVPVTSDPIDIKQVWFVSKDGTRVPMFVAHRRGLKLDGSNPALLTGYGGFNVSQNAPISRHGRRSGSRTGASTPLPTCAAAASSARMAPRGDARQEAERLRRLHRRRGMARQERLHLVVSARHLGRLERRTARRRRS